MDKAETEYVVTLYGPKDDTQRGNGPPEGKNPYTLFDYRASLGSLNEEQLRRFLVDGEFSSHRTKPLCHCCPHLFVVESLQEINKDSRDFRATVQYANMKDIRVHATSCRNKGAIIAEIEWLKKLAASIRGDVEIDTSNSATERSTDKADDEKLMKASEAIKLSGLSRSTFYRRVNAGLIVKRETETGTYYLESSIIKCKRENQ